MDDTTKSKLLKAAQSVLGNAYAPYSGVFVSSALIDDKGRIFTGVNVENSSFSLTICAERNAISSAISAGAKSIKGILILSSIGAIPPCGACRQVIAEFSKPETTVLLASKEYIEEEWTIGALLPSAFKLLDKSENKLD
ncbi:cytidine deaminase [bacterium]|nr:cytidine deaminase [bacterium]